ncbi:MAG: PEGA domain-containing protein [Myxococcota bacterium]
MRPLVVLVLMGCSASLAQNANTLVVTTEAIERPEPGWTVRRGDRREAAAEAVAEQIEEARRQSVAFRTEEALATLGEAQAALERDGAESADFDALHLVWALRALVESNEGREERALEALREAARLRPGADLDPVTFPPDLIERYRRLATEARAEPPGSVVVNTQPSGARVRLDGVEFGASPATVRAVPGRHHLRIDALMHESRVLPVQLTSEGNAPIDVELPEASAEGQTAQLLTLASERVLSLPPELRARLPHDYLVRVLEDETVGVELASGRTYVAATSDSPVRRALASFEPNRRGLRIGLSIAAIVLVGAAATAAILITRDPDPVFRVTPAD